MNNREQFAATSTALLDERDDVALVYAEISGQYFGGAHDRHPRRVINVGIREQLLVSSAAGLSLNGIRPIVHTFSAFLVERAFEQIKLDFAHQGVGGVLVGSGGSYDMSALGRTHQSPGDVAALATIPGIQIHAPTTPAEVDAVIRAAAADEGLHYVRVAEATSSRSLPADGRIHVLRRDASGPTYLVWGGLREQVVAAAEQTRGTVLASTGITPLDVERLREFAGRDVVVVEPWWEGTSLSAVTSALNDRPRRFLAVGTRHEEVRRYGTPDDHADLHGLNGSAIARRVQTWLSSDGVAGDRGIDQRSTR